jgi:TolB-like protein
MSDEIIERLAKIQGLRVAARTSSFSFKGRAVDIREIAKQLRVDTVVEGTVRKAGDRLLIAVQLNRAQDGIRIWPETYERSLSDVFAVQSEIARGMLLKYPPPSVNITTVWASAWPYESSSSAAFPPAPRSR